MSVIDLTIKCSHVSSRDINSLVSSDESWSLTSVKYIVGGYKGYGLGMLVEIFCGILAGAQYGGNIRKWKTTGTIANLVCIL